MSKTTFADLGVPASLVGALHRAGINEPFPIQAATLPDAIGGRDVLARAQTGSGKTLAFGLAMLTRFIGRPAAPMQPYGLILVPTRELAMQVSDGLAPLADAAGMRIRLIAGGMPYPKQIEAIRRGVHILVATPGRLMDLVNRGAVDLSETSITVLDEADQMADMGFLPQVKELMDLTRPNGQVLLFSATLDGDVDTIVRQYMNKPARHELAPAKASVDTMEHHVLVVHPMDKEDVATRIAARDGRTIFFVRTQAGVDRLTDYFIARGVPAGGLHGGKTQAVRSRTLAAFKDGTTQALVATDVAARGIHVDGITLVVNVDAPTGPKDYLHRAGRTARAGESGVVVMIAAPRQQRTVLSLVERAGVKPKVTRIRPVDAELVEITEAREPSGIPWTPPRDNAAKRTAGGRAPRPTRDSSSRYERKPKPHHATRDDRVDGGDRPERSTRTPAPHSNRPNWDKNERYGRPNRETVDRAPASRGRDDRSRDDRDRIDRDRNDRPNWSDAERYGRPARYAPPREDRGERSSRPARAERAERRNDDERPRTNREERRKDLQRQGAPKRAGVGKPKAGGKGKPSVGKAKPGKRAGVAKTDGRSQRSGHGSSVTSSGGTKPRKPRHKRGR